MAAKALESRFTCASFHMRSKATSFASRGSEGVDCAQAAATSNIEQNILIRIESNTPTMTRTITTAQYPFNNKEHKRGYRGHDSPFFMSPRVHLSNSASTC